MLRIATWSPPRSLRASNTAISQLRYVIIMFQAFDNAIGVDIVL